MSAPVVLYGPADVGAALGVSTAVVNNWIRRHPGTVPAPDYVRTTGAVLYADLAEWHAWHAARRAEADRRAERHELAARHATERAELDAAHAAERAGLDTDR